MMALSTRLRAIREALGDTQKIMSKRLGLGENTWQSYERGMSHPDASVLEKLASFGFDGHWILTGKGHMRPVDERLDEIEALLQSRMPTTDELGRPEWMAIRQEMQLIALDEGVPDRSRARADTLLVIAFQDAEAEQRRSANLRRIVKQLVELDEELNARVVDGISRLYKDEGAGLSPMDLGRLAARVYADLVNGIDDPRERLIGLKVALEQLRRELRKPADDTSSKRLA